MTAGVHRQLAIFLAAALPLAAVGCQAPASADAPDTADWVTVRLASDLTKLLTDPGGPLVIRDFDPQLTGQRWLIDRRAGTGPYIIGDGGIRCVSAPNGSQGTQIVNTDCAGSDVTHWRFVPQAGGFRIRSDETPYCLGAPDSAKPVVLWPCGDSGTNDVWLPVIEPASLSPSA
ncbi:ricin-type beta-trefoil lectin domain protein [Kitasatospora sp. NPDC006786]|uniref:RICIN domain-containing protein n=1 Tax=unclassified Kitasatospora TaxID=2633591 RepID=UPI0033F47209